MYVFYFFFYLALFSSIRSSPTAQILPKRDAQISGGQESITEQGPLTSNRAVENTCSETSWRLFLFIIFLVCWVFFPCLWFCTCMWICLHVNRWSRMNAICMQKWLVSQKYLKIYILNLSFPWKLGKKKSSKAFAVEFTLNATEILLRKIHRTKKEVFFSHVSLWASPMAFPITCYLNRLLWNWYQNYLYNLSFL